jgi:hypothetical protein
MIRRLLTATVLTVTCAAPAAAQSGRIYAGGVGGIDMGSRGPIAGGSLGTAGAFVGVRLSEGWSVEGEIEHGFRTRERTDEGLWISSAGPGSTREEIERAGVFARFHRTEKAGVGWSVLGVWRTQEPGRLNAALLGGVTSRRFERITERTTTAIAPGSSFSPDDPQIRDNVESIETVGGGLTGGVMVLVRVAPMLTVAPEFRYTVGLITDESMYKVARLGVKVAWGF